MSVIVRSATLGTLPMEKSGDSSVHDLLVQLVREDRDVRGDGASRLVHHRGDGPEFLGRVHRAAGVARGIQNDKAQCGA